ncbi:MAG: amidohydrolase family protein [Sedimentisphaerales bacterium]|nr:amidohydrolase family protein [Sedimentisphaerales bacterium]
MIVDCHTHISGLTEDHQGTAERLSAQNTVDKCFVLAGPGLSSEQANNEVAEFVGKYPDKMVGFAVVDPTKDDFSNKSLTKMSEKQSIKGLVLYCSGCDFHPAHSKAMRLYEIAQELKLPVFFHNGSEHACGNLQYAQPFLIDEIARTFDKLKIIIGSMGLPFVEQTLVMLARHPNVYADLTIKIERNWQLYTTVLSCYEYGVLDKLLFGSGFPFADAGVCVEALLGFNKRLGDTNLPTVPRGELRSIIERDTIKLLSIEQ